MKHSYGCEERDARRDEDGPAAKRWRGEAAKE
jgi:hypothetical protein